MFNKIENIKKREIIDNFTNLEELVNYIKSPNRNEVKYILEARKFDKKSEEYRKIKTSNIPCTVINFNHNKYVKSSTITNSTGYMFLDVDEEEEMGNINQDYVCAYWRSLSNIGFSVIVKVNNLNKENLKNSYKEVGNILDIKYDTAAISKDRLTVLSYDPDAYINNSPKEINLEYKKKTHHDNIEKYISNDYYYNGSKIRYNNLEETISDLKIKINYDKNGLFDFGSTNQIKYSKVIVPFQKIKKGKRNMVMSSIIHQLISLNPNFNKDFLLRIAHKTNITKISPSLPSKTIDYLFKKKYNSNIKPYINASRRFLYDPRAFLSPSQKRSLNAKKIGVDKVNKSKERIKRALVNWNYNENGKITNKKVSQITKMNIKTINKYCSVIIKKLKISKIKKETLH